MSTLTSDTALTNNSLTTTTVTDNTVYSNGFNVDMVTITDEHGGKITLGPTEVSRLYADALEYRRILRFAKIFKDVKGLYREMLTLIKLVDPLDEDELQALEKEQQKNGY